MSLLDFTDLKTNPARRFRLFVICFLLLTGVLFPGCYYYAPVYQNTPESKEEIHQDKLREIKKRGVLQVGTAGDYKPMTYLDPDTGEYTGFDIALAEDLANELGVRLQFVPTTWPTLMEDTLSGKFDLAIGGITITDDRKEQALMSVGYLGNGKTVLCRSEDADRYVSLKAIDQPGVKVMENPGGLNEKFAREKLTKAEIIIHNENAEIPGLIADGKADVMITEIMEAGFYTRADERLAAPLLDKPFTRGELGVLMPKGNESLLKYVNKFLEKEKKSGRIDDLANTYIYGKGCIGVTAPAFYIKDDDFKEALKILEQAGYSVRLTPSCTGRDGYFAGSDEMRAQDINSLYADDDVDAIICLRGGYGSSRILDKLDYPMIAEHPKPLIGYSDVTALHVAINQNSGISTVHGPMISSLKPDITEYTLEELLEGLSGEKAAGEISLPEGEELSVLVPGTARGYIIGGNLTVITSLIGTDYELKGDGALLLLEDIDEPPYKIDRMLRQLYDSGLFDRVNGILFGEFTGCEDQRGKDLEEVLREYAELSGKPVIMGVPAGHGDNNMYLPLGVEAVMTGEQGGGASLVLSGGQN